MPNHGLHGQCQVLTTVIFFPFPTVAAAGAELLPRPHAKLDGGRLVSRESSGHGQRGRVTSVEGRSGVHVRSGRVGLATVRRVATLFGWHRKSESGR